jgi:murein DD-endopeptidase MepM/ murein hydrolase activator NlpD
MRNIATTRTLYLPEHAVRAAPVKPWIWPLPRLDGAHPCVLPPHGPARTDGLVQLGYPDRTSSSDFVPVFAPQDGVITYAVRADPGTTLCLDHPAGWSTQYSDLETVLALSTDRFSRRRRVRVRAGDVLGYLRTSLQLGFGLSRLVDGEWATIDPADVIHTWIAQPWFAEPPACVGSELAV